MHAVRNFPTERHGRGSIGMPINPADYPPEWKQISHRVREAANWTCQQCGKPCRRPNDPCGSKRIELTTSHTNHNPMDCRAENLRALCNPCHLRYDGKRHAHTRKYGRTAKTQVTIEDMLSEYSIAHTAGHSGLCKY